MRISDVELDSSTSLTAFQRHLLLPNQTRASISDSRSPVLRISVFLQLTDSNLCRDVFSEGRPPNASPGMLAASSSKRSGI